jgi:hypothetical protein
MPVGAYAVRRTIIITSDPTTISPAKTKEIQIISIKLLEPGSLMVPPYEESYYATRTIRITDTRA